MCRHKRNFASQSSIVQESFLPSQGTQSGSGLGSRSIRKRQPTWQAGSLWHAKKWIERPLCLLWHRRRTGRRKLCRGSDFATSRRGSHDRPMFRLRSLGVSARRLHPRSWRLCLNESGLWKGDVCRFAASCEGKGFGRRHAGPRQDGQACAKQAGACGCETALTARCPQRREHPQPWTIQCLFSSAVAASEGRARSGRMSRRSANLLVGKHSKAKHRCPRVWKTLSVAWSA